MRLDGSDRDHVTLVVKNGGTIPPDILPHLFDPFRGGQRQSGRGDGLGLGLYIVSQIVQAHDGHVEVKTGEGRNRLSRPIAARAERDVNSSGQDR